MRGALKVLPAYLEKTFLYLLILIVPILIYPFLIDGRVIDLRKIREIGFYSFGIIILTFLQKNKWLRYFIIWCVINWWLNFFIPRESYVGLTNIFSALALYIGLKYVIKKNIIKINTVLKIVCIVALFQFVWLIMQKFNFDPVFYPISPTRDRVFGYRMPPIGWSGNPVILAIFFAMSSFLTLHYFTIRKIPVFFFIILSSMFILKNATMVICLSAGLIFMFIYKYPKKILPILLIIILLCTFFVYVKKPNFDRLPIWKQLIEKSTTARPIVGCGINYFSHLFIKDKKNIIWNEAHNEPLQIYLELGMIGLCLFTGFIISKYIEFFKIRRNNLQLYLISSLTAFLVAGISMFPFHLAQLSFYAILFLACLDRSYETELLQS